MKGYAQFYDDYLVQKKTPGEIIKAKPGLASLWYDEPDHQYGRPASFYFQLEDLELLSAWSKVDVPVLTIHGEYDWIMSGDDYSLLVKALNVRNHGSAEFKEWPRADHDLLTHTSLEKAFGSDPDKEYDPKLSDFVLAWIRTHSQP